MKRNGWGSAARLLLLWGGVGLFSTGGETAAAGLVSEEHLKSGLEPRQQKEQDHPRDLRADLQVFTGAVGNVRAPSITHSDKADRPYSVEGDTFPDFASAAQRTCDRQNNKCATAANQEGGFSVDECNQQSERCREALQNATMTTFATFTKSDAQFDYYCE